MTRIFDAVWLEGHKARLAGFGSKPDATAHKKAPIAHKSQLPALLESDILPTVLEALRWHPKIARNPDGVPIVWRQNTGAATTVGGQVVRFAFPGCSDILGMLKGGRFLAVECKRIDEDLTGDQAAFLQAVNGSGGLGFVARSVDDVMRELEVVSESAACSQVSEILQAALSGKEPAYRTDDGEFIRWGLVEADIHAVMRGLG